MIIKWWKEQKQDVMKHKLKYVDKQAIFLKNLAKIVLTMRGNTIGGRDSQKVKFFKSKKRRILISPGGWKNRKVISVEGALLGTRDYVRKNRSSDR